jgi:hypothetical protein
VGFVTVFREGICVERFGLNKVNLQNPHKIFLEPDPVIERYKQDVDRTLLRQNLMLSVDERFQKLIALQRFAKELRRSGRAAIQ